MRGRIHRAEVTSGRNLLAFDGELERAVRSRPVLHLTYASADAWAQRMEHAAEVGDVDALDGSRRPGSVEKLSELRQSLCRVDVECFRLNVLLDEPAGGVSADDMADLAQVIRSWVPERSVLLVEHHMELVMGVCDLIWVLDAGRVIASGTPDEIRSDPAVLAAYLGEEGAA